MIIFRIIQVSLFIPFINRPVLVLIRVLAVLSPAVQ